MAVHNRVIWDEGLFVKPQHFQQESKYVDFLIESKSRIINEFLFGFHSLKINEEYLAFGKVGIQEAKGIMPDGTVFAIPTETPTPEPLTITDASMINQVIYLCLPLKADGVLEVNQTDKFGQTRLSSHAVEVKDTFSITGDYTSVNVGKVSLRLMPESEDRSSYSSLAVTRVIDRQPDNSIILDDNFYPTATSINAIQPLKKFLDEISALMRERAKNIAERVGSPSQSGVADVTDFMMLTALNRLHPYYIHLSKIRHVHPERLYSELVATCGELKTFVGDEKLPEKFVAYNHDLPHTSFIPLEKYLKEILGTVMQAKAIPIPIVEQQFGIHYASVSDSSLISSATFILAVKANMKTEEVREQFPQQTKVSSLEKINELINLQLPGIPLIPLPVAPRNLPYHAGFTYFQLDSNDHSWEMMKNASGFGFHIAGDYTELEMEFWAIRNT